MIEEAPRTCPRPPRREIPKVGPRAGTEIQNTLPPLLLGNMPESTREVVHPRSVVCLLAEREPTRVEDVVRHASRVRTGR